MENVYKSDYSKHLLACYYLSLDREESYELLKNESIDNPYAAFMLAESCSYMHEDKRLCNYNLAFNLLLIISDLPQVQLKSFERRVSKKRFRKLLERLGDCGVPASFHLLGTLYFEGRIFKSNLIQAEHYLTKAVELGYSKSQEFLDKVQEKIAREKQKHSLDDYRKKITVLLYVMQNEKETDNTGSQDIIRRR